MSRPAWINVGPQDSVGSAVVAASTDTLTIAAHGLAEGDIVMVDALTGGAVGPLIDGAVYFVRNPTADTFQLSGTRGSQLKTFDTDGTADVFVAVPQYSAQVLRLNDTVTLMHGSADGLGAREGVRPGSGSVVSVAGTTWTVHDHSGVVYPGITSQSGPYRYHQVQDSGGLDPADGTNDRTDALDLLIEDDDEDASGFRRSRVVYVSGTPGGGAPAVTPNALRIGTVLVPAGGTPAPTVQSQAQFTVATGGILPVRSTAERPTAGLYDGMPVFRQDTGAVEVRDNGTWLVVDSWHAPELVEFTSNGTFTVANFPWAKYVDVEVGGPGGGSGGAGATATNQGSVGGGGGGGGYARKIIPVGDLAANETVTVGAGGGGGSPGGNASAGGSSSFGAHCSATSGGGADGTGAVGSTNAPGGAGGNGTGGDVNIPGDDGGNGYVAAGDDGFATVSSAGGYGGSSKLGGATNPNGADAGAAGVAGRSFGGGAAGAFNGEGQAGRSGAAGAPGVVRVWVY